MSVERRRGRRASTSARALASGRFDGARASQLFMINFYMKTGQESLRLEIKHPENMNEVIQFFISQLTIPLD